MKGAYPGGVLIIREVDKKRYLMRIRLLRVHALELDTKRKLLMFWSSSLKGVACSPIPIGSSGI